MKTAKRALISWISALSLVLLLMQPAGVLAQDDDDDWEESAPVEVDDDDYDDDDDVWVDPAVADPAEPDDDGIDDDAYDDDADDGYIDDDDVYDDDSDDGIDDDDDQVDDDAYDDDSDDLDDDGNLDRPVADQAILQLRSGVDANQFANNHDVSVIKSVPGPNIVLVNLNPAQNDADEVTELMTDDDVVWAELNYTSRAPEGSPRWIFSAADGTPRIVDAPALPRGLEFQQDAVCATGASVTVAILDTGVDSTHPALSANLLDNGVNLIDMNDDPSDVGNGIDEDGDGYVDEMVGHGTHVTGTILQVAPEASILPIRVLNSDGVGDTFNVMAGMYYALEQEADVINMSLGSTFDSQAIRSAVDAAELQGAVVVAAAGNGGQSLHLQYPASTDSVISVGATTADGDRADYSNYNVSIDISAPGNDVASAFPGGIYTTASGTSMATPIVAATAVLYLERVPEATPQQVSDQMVTHAQPLNLTDPTVEGMLGAGEIDVNAALDCPQ